MWPYICTNGLLELRANSANNRKEPYFDARMDVDVYRDVAMGDSFRRNGRRCPAGRWYRVKPGIRIPPGAFGFNLHAAGPRVITQKRVSK